jgi:hypothetical protein
MTALKDRMINQNANAAEERQDCDAGEGKIVEQKAAESRVRKKSRAKAAKPDKVDPLFAIFEQHLLNFQDPEIDRKTFIAKVVADYLSYLRKNNVTVPKSLEQPIVEELADQVNVILVKRIYGCFSIEEYRRSINPSIKRRARSRYSRLGFR